MPSSLGRTSLVMIHEGGICSEEAEEGKEARLYTMARKKIKVHVVVAS